MEAGIIPDRAQNSVFNVILVDHFAFALDQKFWPEGDGKKYRWNIDILNASHRIIIKHHVDRKGVLEINPVKELLPAGKLTYWKAG